MFEFFNFLRKKKYVPLTIEERAERFWTWFKFNTSEIERYIDTGSDDSSYIVRITQEMQRFNFLLYPELSASESGHYVLIITPDGNPKGIEPTKQLFSFKPKIEKWIVKKFRQPCDDLNLEFELNHIKYPAINIQAIYRIDYERNKVDLGLFIRDMDKDLKNYQHLAFLYLDHILGEFNTITRVGGVDFCHLNEGELVKGGINLLELRKVIEQELRLSTHFRQGNIGGGIQYRPMLGSNKLGREIQETIEIRRIGIQNMANMRHPVSRIRSNRLGLGLYD